MHEEERGELSADRQRQKDIGRQINTDIEVNTDKDIETNRDQDNKRQERKIKSEAERETKPMIGTQTKEDREQDLSTATDGLSDQSIAVIAQQGTPCIGKISLI